MTSVFGRGEKEVGTVSVKVDVRRDNVYEKCTVTMRIDPYLNFRRPFDVSKC